MKAEIISVGTELLLGQTVNTDAALVAAELAGLGIDLMQIQTVGDNPQRLFSALELAASRSDLIITTGGLGPTDDDLTKSAIAAFAGVPLVEYPEAASDLRQYFGTRPMSANQMRQALLPAGSVIFRNSRGTAPGCVLGLEDGKAIIMLPGPPGELAAMLEKSVLPWLSARSDSVIHSSEIRTFGIGEGAAAELVSDLMQGANPTVAPYAHCGEMFFRVTAKAPDADSARALCAPLVAEICARLGDVVYGLDIHSLEEAVLAGLLARNFTIATAESCTGGLVAKRLTDLPGASNVFGMGLVTYSNAAKEMLLHVPGELLAEFGAVSEQVARAMAENVRSISGSDLGLGITGIAGPDGGTEQKPLGLVYIALATPRSTYVSEHRLKGRYPGRAFVRERAASASLDMARRFLQSLPIPAQY